MTPSCGIGQNVHCVMMHYSLYHASMINLVMRFNGPHLNKGLPWVHIRENFPGV